MISQENIATYLDVVANIETIIATLKATYPSKYKYTRPLKYFKVEENEVVVVCAGYNGEQEYCTFPVSYLYLSKEELLGAVKAEQKADKIKAQLLKEEKEIEERTQDIFLFNKLKEKLNL